MRSIIAALLIAVSSWCWAQDAKPIELAPDAPERHVVVPGDTLWGIASMFLKDPYRWPEIWRMNGEDIKNPHRIYPGQVVILDRSGAQPRLTLGTPLTGTVKLEPRVYVEPQPPIPAIPPNVIEPFLSQPLVVEPGALGNAARVVALPEGRTTVGGGDTVYATGINAPAALWQVFRAGGPLRDPDRPDDLLGIEAIYLGDARVLQAGEPAMLKITGAKQEIARNDHLIPAPPTAIIEYAPHAPAQMLSGRILSLYGSVRAAGRLSVVAISRGRADGLELGHVLAIKRTGVEVENPYGDKVERYRLPDQRLGNLFVFRVFDHVSYALIMNAALPVVVGDLVTTP